MLGEQEVKLRVIRMLLEADIPYTSVIDSAKSIVSWVNDNSVDNSKHEPINKSSAMNIDN